MRSDKAKEKQIFFIPAFLLFYPKFRKNPPWYKYIWTFLFAIVGILVGIMLFRANKKMNKEEQKEFDQNFGEKARQGGMRRMFKQFRDK